MTEASDNQIIALLRQIRADIDDLKRGQWNPKGDAASLERQLLTIRQDAALLHQNMVRLEQRLDRMERRLDNIEGRD